MGKTVLYRLGERTPSGGIPLPTVVAGMIIEAGTNTVTVTDDSTADVPLSSWTWQLINSSLAVVDTKTTQNAVFTSVAAADYTVRLTVGSTIGVSDSKTSASFTVAAAALAAPANLVAGTPSGLTVPLTFDYPAVDTYVTARILHYSTVASVTKLNSSSITLARDATSHDFVAPSSATWYFRLYDVGTNGFASDSDLSSEVSASVGSPGTPPGAFSLNPPTAVTSHRIDLTWTASSDVASYSVYRDTSEPVLDDDAHALQKEIDAATLTLTDGTCAPLTTYYYLVVAYNGAGLAYSNTLSGTTPAQEAWPNNEPGGLTTYVSANGSQKNLVPGATYSAQWQTGLLSNGQPRVSVVADSSSKYGSCVRKMFDIGDTSGFNGKFITNTLGAPALRRIYYRMVFRLSANYQFHSGHEKLFYWGTRQTGNIPFALFLLGGGGGTTGFQMDLSYNNNNCSFSPSGRRWRTQTTRVSVDVWNTVEIYAIAQSAPGVADGSLVMHCNDVEVTDWQCVGTNNICTQLNWVPGVSTWTNYDFVPACAVNHLFGSIEAPLYFGGSNQGPAAGWTKQVRDWIDISELYISGLV